MSTQVIPTLPGGPGTGPSGMNASERVNTDTPPFSRVFVVCSKHHIEEELRATFQQFGLVEDVWMVKVGVAQYNSQIFVASN